MIWLEMSRDSLHGGGDWGFSSCLWSPTRKIDGSRWSFWESLLSVEEGDPVLHLRGSGKKAAFVGTSTAASRGYETQERPPIAGQWSHTPTFLRVNLSEYTPFVQSVSLQDIFASRNRELREYFELNKKAAQKERLFYVIQANRLQCLNGAYLSQVSQELLNILLAESAPPSRAPYQTSDEVSVGERTSAAISRIGQRQFSDQVRSNFGSLCCFPGCNISEKEFLVGAHIARWSDKPELRGQISNGLCLCLMHDKAFELGLFTIDAELRIWVSPAKIRNNNWAQAHLFAFHGQSIRLGVIPLSEDALLHHWERTGCYPTN